MTFFFFFLSLCCVRKGEANSYFHVWHEQRNRVVCPEEIHLWCRIKHETPFNHRTVEPTLSFQYFTFRCFPGQRGYETLQPCFLDSVRFVSLPFIPLVPVVANWRRRPSLQNYLNILLQNHLVCFWRRSKIDWHHLLWVNFHVTEFPPAIPCRCRGPVLRCYLREDFSGKGRKIIPGHK